MITLVGGMAYSDAIILGALRERADPAGTIRISYADLSSGTGIAFNTVVRALHRLIASGQIERVGAKQQGKTNLYRVKDESNGIPANGRSDERTPAAVVHRHL